jgi:vacuolar-type H+-ATPase subunit H
VLNNDLEYLKEIKETEDSAEDSIRNLAAEQERQLAELRSKLEDELRHKTEELQKLYKEAMQDAENDSREKAQHILDEARKKADSMKLELTNESIKRILIEEIMKYLEG